MLVLLIILIFIHHVGVALYSTQGVEPLPTFEFLYQGAFLCGVVWLLRTGPQRSSVSSVYCHGMLVGFGWLIILPYHLIATRGTKGILSVFALFGSILVAWMVMAVIISMFQPVS